MELRQSEFVSTFNQDGIRVGNVDAGFNDGAADQNVVSLVVEIRHHPFKFCLSQLTMGYADRKIGQ